MLKEFEDAADKVFRFFSLSKLIVLAPTGTFSIKKKIQLIFISVISKSLFLLVWRDVNLLKNGYTTLMKRWKFKLKILNF